MAPIKFEEQIKDKMEERRMQPSIDAWDKLNSRLNEANDTKKNKGVFWIGIAASVIGVVLAVTFFTRLDNEITVEPTVVDTQIDEIKTNEIQNYESNQIEQDSAEELPVEAKKQKTQSNKASKKSPLQQKLKKEQTILTKSKEQEVIANVETVIEEAKTNDLVTKKETIEDVKAKEVVAQILDLKKENKVVTEEEINALLDAAYKEITLDKLLKENSKTVDADALLESVEDELEQSFRTRVFEMLKSSYKEIKTAVAERNN